MAGHPGSQRQTETKAELLKTFGVLMSPAEVAATLKLPSPRALAAAQARGSISLKPSRLGVRRTPVYRTEDVAAFIDEEAPPSSEENDM